MPEDIRPHYDTVASTFLKVSTTMIAIIGSLTPFLRAQNGQSEYHKNLFFAVIVLLLITTISSLFGLMERESTSLKRNLCRVSAIPLLVSILIILMIIVT
ncbi:hypothetical protein GTO27_09900 [Candidatus Bathyarchaeota archaeon]|nr:hypothetical protein [Candidatus Bathyarchaeota archaeon]